ncbi:MAG: DUF3667 domain-containing protein [Chromatiales bacterium]|nr:MAG: DUF3667 domain-containing protein [Chromatiales bacterium]
MPLCKNCQAGLNGAYCSTCGQKDVDLERPILGLLGGVIKETFELDGRSALTIKTLFRHPGLLTSKFLDGRRRRYTSPLRLYLVISIVFFVVVAWLAQSGILLEPGQDPGFDAAVQARFLSDDLPRLMFLLLPVFALLLKIVFLQRLYFDHLIFSLHLHSAGYIVLALAMPLENVAGKHLLALILQGLLLAYFIAYFVLAVRRVYGPAWFALALKSAAVLLGYMMVVSLVIENTSTFMIIAD